MSITIRQHNNHWHVTIQEEFTYPTAREARTATNQLLKEKEMYGKKLCYTHDSKETETENTLE